MRKKILGALLVVAIAAGAAFNVNMNSDSSVNKLISTQTLEALAQWNGGWDGNENGGSITLGYKYEYKKVELWVGGRLTYEWTNVCSPTYELVFRCTF